MNKKMYFLVEAELTADTHIDTEEIRTALAETAQPDEEQGFVKMRAWVVEHPLFEGRTGRRTQVIHQDKQILENIGQTVSGFISAKQ